MWICESCGCQGIAASLDFCPVCRTVRPDPDPGTPRTAEDDIRDEIAVLEAELPHPDLAWPSLAPGKARDGE